MRYFLFVLNYLIAFFLMVYFFVATLNLMEQFLLTLGILLSVILGFYFGKEIISAKKYPSLKYFSIFILAVFYFLAVLSYTLWDPLFNRVVPVSLRVQLIPFKTIFTYSLALFTGSKSLFTIFLNLVGNFCIFMPMVFFLIYLFPSLKEKSRVILVIFLTVLGIECTQLIFAVGTFDVDDLILNVLGSYVFFRILSRITTCQIK